MYHFLENVKLNKNTRNCLTAYYYLKKKKKLSVKVKKLYHRETLADTQNCVKVNKTLKISDNFDLFILMNNS